MSEDKLMRDDTTGRVIDTRDERIEALEKRVAELEKVVQGFKSLEAMRWKGN